MVNVHGFVREKACIVENSSFFTKALEIVPKNDKPSGK